MGVSPVITGYLREGAFGGALRDAGPELRRLATARGWLGGSPIVRRRRPGYLPPALVGGAGLVVCLRCCWVGSRRGVRAGQNEVCDGDWGFLH